MNKSISNALISVYHKDKLDSLLHILKKYNVNLFSTGGTFKFITENGFECNKVEDLTSYPSILGGRVKTLHPKVFGGILARRANKADIKELESYEMPQFDLVIVDLYPFEETVKQTNDEAEIIEKVDIGGIALIRAAAKNFKDVVVVSSRGEYETLGEILEKNNGETTLEDRKFFATAAFATSSHYDAQIYNYFNSNKMFDAYFYRNSFNNAKGLRYGENPHQKGTFYGNLNEVLEQVHGKEISYNNLLDIDAAVNVMEEFEETTFAILKHNNTCGLASKNNLLNSYKAALAGDNISAFGGVLICNKELDVATAEEIHKLFCEIIIAPSYQNDALEILKQKKNRIILIQKNKVGKQKISRTILNGMLVQDKDTSMEKEDVWKFATNQKPNDQQTQDLIFANKAVKHLKSNGIALAKNNQLIGMGCGQTSRIDALKHAILKAKHFGFDLKDAVMASDAFFPFPDCVEIAEKEGIKAVIQPGGSIKDNLTIDYCNEHNVTMVLTGKRHFRH